MNENTSGINPDNVGQFDIVVRDNGLSIAVSKDKAEELVQTKLLENLNELTDKIMDGLKIGCAAGNAAILRMSAEMVGLLQPANGAPIINNIINNNNANVVNGDQKFSIESIIRQMDARDHRKREEEDNVIDAEVIDPDIENGKG